MKDYLPSYKKVKGEPRALSKIKQIKESLSKTDQGMIDEFVKDCKITISSKHKLHNAESHIILFCDVIEKPLKKIERNDISNFVSLINQNVKSKHSRIEFFFFLKKFLKKYYKNQEFVDVIKNKKETGNYNSIDKKDLITAEELERILRIADNLKLKALITLLYESGGRPDEVRNLKWKDVKINDDGYAEVRLFSSKKQESRTIIVKDCVVHLERWKREYSYPNLKSEDFIFITRARDKAVTKEGFYKMLQK